MTSIPIVSIVGRQNVGKSTIFNRLTRTDSSLVNDYSGVTSDRKYGIVKHKNYKFIIVDTIGINCRMEEKSNNLLQTFIAIEESSLLLFIVDGRNNVTEEDINIVNYLRKYEKNILVVINKIDKVNSYSALGNFYALGIKEIISVSALYKRGINSLLRKILSFLIKDKNLLISEKHSLILNNKVLISKNENILYKNNLAIKIAIVGSPNVGKSTLVNCIAKEKRMTVHNIPGTTRDSVHVPTYYNNKLYILIDTVGIRQKKKNKELIERYSILKTLNVINEADVTLLIISAQNKLSDQDLSILNKILKNGKSLVIGINKCDILSKNDRFIMQSYIKNRISNFLTFVRIHFISALNNNGIKELFLSIEEAYKNSVTKINVYKLTNLMNKAFFKYKPPLVNGGKSIKLRYIRIIKYNPIVIVMYGTYVNQIPYFYKKYLIKYFYQCLKIKGSIVRLVFKDRLILRLNS